MPGRVTALGDELRAEVFFGGERVVRRAAQREVWGNICAKFCEGLQVVELEVARLATPFTACVDVGAAPGVALKYLTTFGSRNVAATLARRGATCIPRVRGHFVFAAPARYGPTFVGLVAALARCFETFVFVRLLATLDTSRCFCGRSRSVGDSKLAFLERRDAMNLAVRALIRFGRANRVSSRPRAHALTTPHAARSNRPSNANPRASPFVARKRRQAQSEIKMNAKREIERTGRREGG